MGDIEAAEPGGRLSRRGAWAWIGGTVGAAAVTAPGRAAAAAPGPDAMNRQRLLRVLNAHLTRYRTRDLPGDLGRAARDPRSLLRVALDGLYAPHAGEAPPARDLTGALAGLHAAIGSRDLRLVRVVTLGSSTTWGIGASAPARRYVNRLAQAVQRENPLLDGSAQPATAALADAASTATAGVQFVNGAVGGSSSATYLTAESIGRIAALAPDLVLHMVGANDYALAVTPERFEQNLRDHRQALATALGGAGVHLYVHSFERGSRMRPGATWRAYGDALRRIAVSDPASVAFVDLSGAYERMGFLGADPYRLRASDRTHQTDAGHAVMARLLLHRINAGLDSDA